MAGYPCPESTSLVITKFSDLLLYQLNLEQSFYSNFVENAESANPFHLRARAFWLTTVVFRHLKLDWTQIALFLVRNQLFALFEIAASRENRSSEHFGTQH